MIQPIYLEVCVLVLGLLLVLFEAFAGDEDKTPVAWVGIAGLAVVFVLTFFTANLQTTPPAGAAYWSFYRADFLALFFKRFALVTTIVVLIMSIEYKSVVQKYIFGSTGEAGIGEFYTLPIFTCVGLMWMASAVDFIMIFVSLELVTISFYVLVSYMRRSGTGIEAGVKYLILGALSTGFLVYGITWIFGLTGQTGLDQIGVALRGMKGSQTPVLFGFMLIIVGLGFKVAAAPFQLWVPDVYQGAPTPITAFLSVGSKAAGFVVLMRVLEVFVSVPLLSHKVIAVVAILAAFSLIYGNFAAMPQNNMKRLLAYSSIAHAGYLLVAVASLGSRGAGVAIAYYLAGYLLMTLLSFLVLIVVSRHSAGDDIAHFNGLNKRSPYLAFGMLVSMASLAGIPFTVGFFGKFLVFYAAWEQGHFCLIALGVATVATGFYYYLKVVRAMYWQEPVADAIPIRVAPLTRVTISVLSLCIFAFGIYPAPILHALDRPVAETARLVAR